LGTRLNNLPFGLIVAKIFSLMARQVLTWTWCLLTLAAGVRLYDILISILVDSILNEAIIGF